MIVHGQRFYLCFGGGLLCLLCTPYTEPTMLREYIVNQCQLNACETGHNRHTPLALRNNSLTNNNNSASEYLSDDPEKQVLC